MVTLELIAALPYHPAVFISGVPHFRTVIPTAFSAEDHRGKYAVATVPLFQFLTPSHLCLHQIPLCRLNNGRVAVLYIVLGHLALVGFHFLLQKVYCKGFLQNSVSPVFLILQNALNGGNRPFLLAAGCGDALCGEGFRNGAGGLALHKQCVDPLYDFGFLRYDFRCAIGTLALTKEGSVGHRNLAVSKPFPLTPGDILRDGSALLLCQGGHDSD